MAQWRQYGDAGFGDNVEQAMIRFYYENIRRSDTIVDAGANFGGYTVLGAQLAKRVIAFEPHPHNFEILSINTQDLPNCDIHQAALGVRFGNGFLVESQGNCGGHHRR